MYKVISCEIRNKPNPKTGRNMNIHYANVVGPDGNTTSVQMGFKPTHRVGDVVAGIKQNKWGDWEFDSSANTQPPGSLFADKPAAAPVRNRGVFPIPKDSGEFSIIRQSALKAAVDTVAMISDSCSLSYDEASDLIIGLAYKYADFSSGHREEKAVENILKGELSD